MTMKTYKGLTYYRPNAHNELAEVSLDEYTQFLKDPANRHQIIVGKDRVHNENLFIFTSLVGIAHKSEPTYKCLYKTSVTDYKKETSECYYWTSYQDALAGHTRLVEELG